MLQVSQGQEVTLDYRGQMDSEVHKGKEEIQEELDSLDQLGIQDLVDKQEILEHKVLQDLLVILVFRVRQVQLDNLDHRVQLETLEHPEVLVPLALLETQVLLDKQEDLD